jgi:hypothetical protein
MAIGSRRVTRKLNKNSPNIWKCSQNWSQNIKPKLKVQNSSAFDVKIGRRKTCFKTAYFPENVKQMLK